MTAQTPDSMLTFVPGGPGPAAASERVVDATSPEVADRVHDHRAALAALDQVLADAPARPTPPRHGEIRTPTTGELREQWPSAPSWPAEPPMAPPPPVPFDLGHVDPGGVLVPPGFPPTPPWVTTTDATVDRVVIAAVDHLLSSGTTGDPSADRLERYDETIPLREPERPLAGPEATLFEGAIRRVVDLLRSALGSAYIIEDRIRS
jgi:hypothetical protein